MNRRLIVRSEAESDIAEAAWWHDEREAGLGWEFTLEIRAAIRRITENPFLHLQIREIPEVHRILTGRFPYRIFYIVRSDAIVVFAVLHGARNDSEWTKRL